MASYGPRRRRLRNEYLRAHPTCEDCGEVPATEVHHVNHQRPGDPGFYDPERLRALCNPCHRKRSQRERVRR
jgi:5-methylcytosine-specific restriction protein A